MPQIDLTANSSHKAPAIDANGGHNSVHVPNGENRQSAADQAALCVKGVVTRKVTVGTIRFANPA